MNDLENKHDIDHIKTERKFDNRKSNLRIATRSQNNTNKGIMKCNTSGATGVRWHSRDCRWEAWVNVDKKHKYLGRFDNFEDAVKARKDAEKIYYGDFSYDKSQEIIEQEFSTIADRHKFIYQIDLFKIFLINIDYYIAIMKKVC